MDVQDHFNTLARYNAWATQRLMLAIDGLDDVMYRQDCGLFFKSIHGTLNHLLVGEHLLWYPRFAVGESPRLDLGAEVETDRHVLRDRLLVNVERWQPLIANLAPTQFAGKLRYTTTTGMPVCLPFGATLMHVFNHATHHRGQITAAITALGHTCPVLDLVYMLQQENK